MSLPSRTASWKALQSLAASPRPHLRELLLDDSRTDALFVEWEGIVLDYTRQLVTTETMKALYDLANEVNLKDKIEKMFQGVRINETENRSVLHVALRATRSSSLVVDGNDVIPEVHAVREKIRKFSESIRSGEWVGVTGKPLTDVVAIGIGGSFLGPAFIHTALETHRESSQLAAGRRLRFLANVDPEDVSRALSGLNPETTLAIVVSKTFTTAETMLNARTVKAWFVKHLGESSIPKHMVAVSTALKLVQEFGINPDNAFGFWDWVGGRFSASSAVGVLPLSLQYGYPTVECFLDGMNSVDEHFRTAPFEKNIPVLMGLLSVWNTTFLDISANAILPYCQALSKLAPHIQQVSMESNGKGVTMDGNPVDFPTGEIIFGEPGTNGQHSFYQLIHQGRLVSCDLIGLAVGQQAIFLNGEPVSNHDELMSNFFAQADALAYGKTPEELKAEGVPDSLIPHKTFTGNRPSLSILLPHLGAREIGQMLALYEHRMAVQGFLWGINSFDQWGVELGKVLAKQVRTAISKVRNDGVDVQQASSTFNKSTSRLFKKYIGHVSEYGVQYNKLFTSPFDHFSRGLDGSEVLQGQ